MKLGVLFSGGKDSMMAAWLAKKQGHDLSCLITIESENQSSYMFHTPSISQTKIQAKLMNIPLLQAKTKGEKEIELIDLENTIKEAIKKYNIQGIVTGALHSDYQASRIQKICDELKIKCINPLWHKKELPYLQEIIDENFDVIIVGVASAGLDESWLGSKINKRFIEDVTKVQEKYKIHVAGEGGEFETFVLNCPLFKKPLKITSKKIYGEKESWKMEIKVK